MDTAERRRLQRLAATLGGPGQHSEAHAAPPLLQHQPLHRHDTSADEAATAVEDDPTVVLVTHVTAFLGPSAVLRLLDAGFRVAAHDPSFAQEATRRDWTATMLAKARGGPAATGAHLVAIAEGMEQPEALVAAVVRHFGRLDVLVSNDPFPANRSPLEDGNTALLEDTLAALVVRPYALASAVVRQLRCQPPRQRVASKLVFVTSAAPLRGLPYYAPYVTARGAANAMVRSLAQELAAEGITVNAIAPNFVASPSYFPPRLLQDVAVRSRIEAKVPLRRLATPAEAAETILFLASSPHSDFYTGQIFAFAGGWA